MTGSRVPLRMILHLPCFDLSLGASFGDEGSSRMVVRAIVAGAVLAVLASQPASAVVRISNDAGGQIGPYLDKLASLRSSGQSVVIDGPCLSACTLLLGIIPRERICVTPRARLGFHAAWKPDANGNKRLSREGTRALWDIYPGNVRAWLVAPRRTEAEDGVSLRHRTRGDVHDLPVAIAVGIGGRALALFEFHDKRPRPRALRIAVIATICGDRATHFHSISPRIPPRIPPSFGHCRPVIRINAFVFRDLRDDPRCFVCCFIGQPARLGRLRQQASRGRGTAAPAGDGRPPDPEDDHRMG